MTPTIYNDLLNYDPETGVLRWKQRDPRSFTRESRGKSWNARYAGKLAFTAVAEQGYAVGTILCKRTTAHRVIWKMVYGYDPVMIDHINGDRRDNRLVNLREVTNAQNSKNSGRVKHEGVGVIWIEHKRKWRANIKVCYRNIHLGYYDTKADALAARLLAERSFGFSETHGKRLPFIYSSKIDVK